MESKSCSVGWWWSWAPSAKLLPGPDAREARVVAVSIRTAILGPDWAPGSVSSLPHLPAQEGAWLLGKEGPGTEQADAGPRGWH